jgi:predicted RNase H-like HicB family nuclease
MDDKYEYIALFQYENDGISISFPDLPGCFSCADTTHEAFINAKEALGLHLWSMINDHEFIPEPSSNEDILVKILKSFGKTVYPALITVHLNEIANNIVKKVYKDNETD